MEKAISRIRNARHTTFSSLKVRNFRLYFMGQAISVSGTFMQTIAQAWLVLKLTNSGTALGVVTALQYLPILLFGPVGGVVADRFPKRRLLVMTQTVSGILAIALGALVWAGAARIWMVYALALALGLVNAIDNPTRQTFIQDMVGKDEVRNAVTLNASMVNLSRVIGPAIAAAIIATAGLAPCFILNGLSYAAVVAGLLMMRTSELHTLPPQPKKRGQLMEGFRYALSEPVIRTALAMVAIIGTLTFEYQVSLPLLAQFTFHGDAEILAALTAAIGVGAAFGGLLIASQKRTSLKLLVRVAFMFGLANLAVAVMPTLWLALAALLFVGFFSVYLIAVGNTIIQLDSAPQMRGRVMAFWSMAFLGSTAVGGPIIGWVGENVGPRMGLAVGGAAAVAAALWGAWAMRKNGGTH